MTPAAGSMTCEAGMLALNRKKEKKEKLTDLRITSPPAQ
jgi:hypothetical protein